MVLTYLSSKTKEQLSNAMDETDAYLSSSF